jgi:hypothetical protein
MRFDLRNHPSAWIVLALGLATATGCSADNPAGSSGVGVGAGSGEGGSSSSDGGASSGDGGDSSASLVTVGPGAGGGGGGELIGDPKTCEQAADAKTYLGCDFYPTVNANAVWNIFDFAVVVANAGDEPATVTVDRGGSQVATATVAANSLEKLYLPWVPELKGPEANCTGGVTGSAPTGRLASGAYHLVSSVPVTVYQFSALEYGPQGGPPGKDWSQCPGNSCGTPCFSYSNDASLLLPSTALTNNYRVAGYPSWNAPANQPAFLSITGTVDATTVSVTFGPLGGVVAGGDVPGGNGGQTVQFPIARGEVVQMMATIPGDLSGTLVQSDKPVQVIHGLPCTRVPANSQVQACDHVEESVLPAETLGEHYVVTRPTGPLGQPVGHVVRFVGNVNQTTLTYPAGAPPNAPTTINAGQLVDLGIVNQDFEVEASNEFAIATFQQGGSVVDPGPTGGKGDPAQSVATGVEQYRTKYVFLAPSDYDISFVDIVMPTGAQVTLDGAPLSVSPTPIGSDFGVARVQLSAGNNGAHLLESTEPVGIQVMGYGLYTSYQYPGGLNLNVIAPPPPPPPPPN